MSKASEKVDILESIYFRSIIRHICKLVIYIMLFSAHKVFRPPSLFSMLYATELTQTRNREKQDGSLVLAKVATVRVIYYNLMHVRDLQTWLFVSTFTEWWFNCAQVYILPLLPVLDYRTRTVAKMLVLENNATRDFFSKILLITNFPTKKYIDKNTFKT